MTKLDEIMGHIRHGHVYIQTHNFPDPDAIASAFGLQQLLKNRGVEATICYKGKIDRYNTLKLIEWFQIRLEDIEDVETRLRETDEIILVDAQKGNSNIIDMTGDEIICIDHHPTFEKVKYRYTDIRPEIGACSSIIAQYFFENHVAMDMTTATVLTYGIRSDTDKLSRGTSKLDMEMLYQMFDKSNHDIISLLENRELYFEDLMAYSKAIESIKVYDNVSFASTGENCPEALIASVSDFMLALVEVQLSIVYSIRREGVKLSVRSEAKKYDAGRITSLALKELGNGGGHAAMAGGFIPLAESADPIQMSGIIQERFMKILREG